ncbi:MAG: OmpA family protein [Fidelibacterota bacterium]
MSATAVSIFVSLLLTVQWAAADLPVLTLSKEGDVEAFPGDTVRYTLSYVNSGTDTATGVTVVDTLSPLVSFLQASLPHTYTSGDPSTVTWEIGTVAPGVSGQLFLEVQAAADFQEAEEIVNTAWISSNEGITDSAVAVTANILPMNIILSSYPKVIMGDGVSRSTLTARVYTFLGGPIPDGIPVSFTQDIGTIPEGQDTVATENGMATSTLISDVMTQGSRHAIVNGRANFTLTEFASDTTTVIFVLGAFEGSIVDAGGDPVPGAAVHLVRESTGRIVGKDTTGEDGTYFMPVHLRERFHFVFTTEDEFGNPVVIEQPVVADIPTRGMIVPNLNSVSGWLLDRDNGERIREAGIPVIISDGGEEGVRDTTYSDSTGFYVFTNLQPGQYNVDVVYHGILAYEDARISVDLTAPGRYVPDASIVVNRHPFFTYKRVDRPFAEQNDTLTYRIVYGSTEAALPQRIYIADNLPQELTFIPGSYELTGGIRFDSYDPVTNRVTFIRDGLERNQVDSLTFKARVDGDFSAIDPASRTGSITNSAIVTQLQDTVSSLRDARSRATTKIFLDILTVTKEANRRSVETGDFVTYTVTLKNQSDQIPVRRPIITDDLPYGFRYREGRSVWQGEKIDDPSRQEQGQRLRLTWTMDDTLSPGERRVLRYRTVAGITALYGENENRVRATAIPEEGALIHSSEAVAPVIVRPGILGDLGLIFGKVYYDRNMNRRHDPGEPVGKGVEIVLENGTRVTTDLFGKYSIPNVRFGDHVLRINDATLPGGTRVMLNSADFLGDERSRMVTVSPGGIARANFALEVIPLVKPEIREVGIFLSETTQIRMRQRSPEDEIRYTVYRPWTFNLRGAFLPGRADLREEAIPELQKVGAFLQWQYLTTVEIVGHTDNLPPPPGSPYPNNLALSRARAEAVMAFLDEEMDILPDRMTAEGRGAAEPLGDNATPEGRALNNRVEIHFIHEHEELPVPELTFQVQVTYPGVIPLNGVRLISLLPSGWSYREGSGVLNGNSVDPAQVTATQVIWNLGTWAEREATDLRFGLVPTDHRQILTVSTLRSLLEYALPDGSVSETDTVVTQITTRVQEMLFRMVLAGTQFDINSADLKPAAIPSLFNLGDFLTWQPQVDITAEGFTDSTGTLDWNMELSANRALSAKNYLVENHGISPDRIATAGYGPQFPVATNRTAEGRALNRRVEVIVNSDFQQSVSMKIAAGEDSLVHEVTYLREPGMPPDVFTLPAGDTSTLKLKIDLLDLEEIDSVTVTVDRPDDIVVLDVPRGNRWTFSIRAGEKRLFHDFELVLSGEMTEERTLRIRVQPFSKGRKKYGLTSKEAVIRPR